MALKGSIYRSEHVKAVDHPISGYVLRFYLLVHNILLVLLLIPLLIVITNTIFAIILVTASCKPHKSLETSKRAG